MIMVIEIEQFRIDSYCAFARCNDKACTNIANIACSQYCNVTGSKSAYLSKLFFNMHSYSPGSNSSRWCMQCASTNP